MTTWSAYRLAAERVGVAVARSLYRPTGKQHKRGFDFHLQDGRYLEAKACATNGRVVVSGAQYRHLQDHAAYTRCILTVYDPLGARNDYHYFHNTFRACARSVRLVVDMPATHLLLRLKLERRPNGRYLYILRAGELVRLVPREARVLGKLHLRDGAHGHGTAFLVPLVRV